MNHIVAYCNPWHLEKSAAFEDMLGVPLRNEGVDILFSANTDKTIDWQRVGLEHTAVFCQCLPPDDILFDRSRSLVWLPMWDCVYMYNSAWWRRFPEHLRIVSYCSALTNLASEAKCHVFGTRYFKDPSQHQRVSWDEGRVLFYWNRTEFLSAKTIISICAASDVSRLIIFDVPDPGFRRLNLAARGRIASQVKTEFHSEFLGRSDFLRLSSQANLFIAPRPYEGVGMSFLEALARGAGVVAADFPTMNEYIDDGETGILLPAFPTIKAHILSMQNAAVSQICNLLPVGAWRLRKVAEKQLRMRPFECRMRLGHQKKIHGIDWSVIGARARSRHTLGYAEWRKSWPLLKQFILNASE